jgi:hypothetical protein
MSGRNSEMYRGSFFCAFFGIGIINLLFPAFIVSFEKSNALSDRIFSILFFSNKDFNFLDLFCDSLVKLSLIFILFFLFDGDCKLTSPISFKAVGKFIGVSN